MCLYATWGLAEEQTFHRDRLHIDASAGQVVRSQEPFQFRSYSDYASAAATGCQVFKEKSQNLWWAHCGPPIRNALTIYSIDDTQ